jgi:hypothetical protein
MSLPRPLLALATATAFMTIGLAPAQAAPHMHGPQLRELSAPDTRELSAPDTRELSAPDTRELSAPDTREL